mgnify:CR=1 FL=1
MLNRASSQVFIGSCTNSRIEDLRAAALIVQGRKVAEGIYAMVVPGSGLVGSQAKSEGLDRIFIEAGFDWREAGCSMCLGMNPDQLAPGERCASTSNRNFEGRQGPGGRTHLMSPAMAASAALTGHLTDARKMTVGRSTTITRSTIPVPVVAAPEPTAPVSIAQRSDAADDGVATSAAAPPAPTGATPMLAYTKIKAIAAPLERANIDTDLIIPARFLKTSACCCRVKLDCMTDSHMYSQAHWSRDLALLRAPVRLEDGRGEARVCPQPAGVPQGRDPRRFRRQLWMR